MELNNVAIVMARGGSKGIPGKNSKKLNGVPLLAYTLDAAYNCDKIGLVVFTTDSPELEDLFRRYAKIYDNDWERSFLISRPDYLGQDHVQVGEVVTHAVRQLEMCDIRANSIVVLQPTSPFRTYEHIHMALEMWDGKSTLLTGYGVGGYYWEWSYAEGTVKPLGHNPAWRQGRQWDYMEHGIVKENGALYVMPWDNVALWQNVRKPPYQFMLMHQEESVDLDNMVDWLLAEKLMQTGELARKDVYKWQSARVEEWVND